MAGNTDFHGFSKFSKLEDWDYNPDFEKLDQRLELRGALADRPSTAPDGAKFVVDDPGSEHDGKRFIYRASSDSWEHRPGNFSELNAEYLYNNAVTLYVRSDGDDSNDGLTASTAKASISSALSDAPMRNNQDAVIIDLDDGSYSGIRFDERTPQLDYVKLRGATDGSGNPATTLTDPAPASHILDVQHGGTVIAEDLSITGGDDGCLQVRDNSSLYLRNVHASDGGEHAALVAWGGYYEDDDATVLDQSAVDGSSAGFKITTARATCRGTYKGDGGTNCVIRTKENGYAMLVGCTVTGEGNPDTTHGIRCFHSSAMKMQDTTIQDCKIAINREMNAFIKTQGTMTYNNVDYEIHGIGGHHREFASDEDIYTLPRNGSTPTNHWGSSVLRGAMHYNDETDLMEYYSRRGTMESGRTVFEESSVTIAAGDYEDIYVDATVGPFYICRVLTN